MWVKFSKAGFGNKLNSWGTALGKMEDAVDSKLLNPVVGTDHAASYVTCNVRRGMEGMTGNNVTPKGAAPRVLTAQDYGTLRDEILSRSLWKTCEFQRIG